MYTASLPLWCDLVLLIYHLGVDVAPHIDHRGVKPSLYI